MKTKWQNLKKVAKQEILRSITLNYKGIVFGKIKSIQIDKNNINASKLKYKHIPIMINGEFFLPKLGCVGGLQIQMYKPYYETITS